MVNIHNMKRERGSSSRNEGNKVYVSNIDFACTHQDLKDVFNKVGEVAFVEMLKDDNQRSKGCAIIRFKENNIADEAIKMMNRTEFKGRKLVVKDIGAYLEKEGGRDSKSKDRKRGRDDDPYDRVGLQSSTQDKFGNTYGLSVQFLESLGIDGPLVDRVFVANLDYSVHEDTLKELFSIAGKVIDVELVKDDEGKSKGFGFIEFDHPVEAVQAISMLHNQIYLDRPLSVQLTRKEKKRRDGFIKLPPGLKAVGPGLGINGNPLKDVARTIEAGNQSSLLGAMPTATGPSSLSVGMDMGGLSQGLNPSLSGGLAGSLHGSLQGNMPNVLSGNLGGGMVGSLGSSNLSSDSIGRGGLGLMDRPPTGLASSTGLGGLGSQGLSNPLRSLTDMGSSSSSSFPNFGGSPFSSQRNAVQISNVSP
ncbi:Myelin expression factor 2 [Armadillidium nasatum]|uniref:Myelin expression factor 2 n=1 Tax=Armadillidium nasatum TaxID=96803 RepID=A0A5N5SMY2_9CRUS|nr:Myelin expression factor 2 [Armadillidium nasatum]